jgi:predicted AAA+ superfamily ATPase
MLYPEPPFNMLISGITGCGKTHFVLDLLQKEYAGKYDHIIIICPTFLYNKTYERAFVLADPDVNPLVINDRLNE